jgi:uncharacterized protein with HEPN domain
MRPTEETDRDGCELVLELIAHIERRIAGRTFDEFSRDKDEIDLTSYRIAVIGETTNRFTSELKARHPEINWRAIYALRNYAVHAYQVLSHEKVWFAATNSLPAVKAVCEIELSHSLARD